MRKLLILLGLWLGVVSSAYAFLFTPPAPFVPTTAAPAGWGTPTNLGTAAATSATSVTITGVTVPAGAMIVVAADESNTGGTPTVTDSASNTYLRVTYYGFISIYRAYNVTALSSGSISFNNTIAYDLNISAFSITGEQTSTQPDDLAVGSSGSSTTPFVASGVPVQSGELFTCAVSYNSITAAYTQDTGHGWATPFNEIVGNSRTLAGGSLIGSGTNICAPTLSASASWDEIITSFKHS